MRVVLLSYHYPPSQEVGAIRASKIARTLRENGASLTVVRAALPTESPEPEPTGPEGTVFSVRPASTPGDWYRDVKAALRPPRATSDDQGSASWTPPQQVSALKRFVLSLLWLPDPLQGFIWPAAKAAAAAIHKSGPGTVLYSSSPPASVQAAALLAHLWTGAPWVLEMRDPWVDNPGKPWYCRSGFSDAVERWLERRCLARADLVVVASDGIRRLLAPKMSGRADRLLTIRNGIDRILDADREPTARPRRIVHVGTCYLGRDPRPFLAALATVARRRRLGAEDVQVELVGRCEWFNGQSIRAVTQELGIEDLVQFVGWLPHDEAQQRILQADLLLLLAERQPAQVPNKLYEYLGTRRRMLVFADPGGETARMVERVGGHVLTTSEDTDLEAKLEGALLDPPRGPFGDLTLLREWSTSEQLALLVSALHAVDRRHRSPRQA
jgi:glycosyltransferase involved in cell wall biosynthesis